MSDPHPIERLMRFHLIRHGPIAPPHVGLINGQRDVACDLSDRDRLAWLAAALPPRALWLTSHLSRSQATAAAIDGSPPPRVDADLAEQAFGQWEGRSWEQLTPEAPRELARFWANPGERRPPGGESFADMVARVQQALARILAQDEHDQVVIVAHAGTVRAFLAVALDDLSAGLKFAVDPLSLTRMDAYVDGTGQRFWTIRQVNGQREGGAL